MLLVGGCLEVPAQHYSQAYADKVVITLASPPAAPSAASPAALPADPPADVVPASQPTANSEAGEIYARRIAKLLEERLAATQAARVQSPVTRPAPPVPKSPLTPVTQPTAPPESLPEAKPPAPSPMPATRALEATTAPARLFGDQIHEAAAQNPKSLLAVLDDQLYGLLDARSARLSHAVASLSAEDRQVAEILIEGISSLRRDLARDKQSTQVMKMQSLLEMAERIRTIAPLQVTRAVLCTRVDGFGVYEPIEPSRFGALRETGVVLYCELTGFNSRMSERKTWETRLTQEIVLYGEQGQVVWRDKAGSMVDSCRVRRNDFFMARLLRFPTTLAEGKYILKVAVVDQIANKVAESTIAVQMSAR